MYDILFLLLFALAMSSLLIFTPQLMNFRIKVLRAVHLRALADWHERHFDFLVKIVRLIVIAILIMITVLVAGGEIRV